MSQLPDNLPENPPDAEGSRFARAHHVLGAFTLLALIIWLLSGFYLVNTGQVAIVERLGKYLSTGEGKIIEVEHGLHYHLPWPIDRVSLISELQNYTLQINEFNTSPAEYSDFKRDLVRQGADPLVLNAIFDPYAVTADKSVVHLEFNVLFRINDPAAWLTSVSHEYSQDYNPQELKDMRNALFHQIAQRAIVDQVAMMPLGAVLREGRAALERAVLNAFQEGLSIPDPGDPTGKTKISLGVSIENVTLSVAQVPDAVQPAYANLIDTQAKAQVAVSNAQADAGASVAKANGDKSTLISDAQTYRQNQIQGAKGESDRFQQVLEQYEKNPQVTRINLWVDAMRTIYAGARRVIFAQSGRPTYITVDPPQFDANQNAPK